jgi:cysteine desulfurase
MRPEAVERMRPFLADIYANPSGSHAASRASKYALEEARDIVAEVLGATTREVVFTGSGSEGDNLAIKGAAWSARARGVGDGVVTTAIEHKAVLGACARLEREGFGVTLASATRDGTVDLDRLADALDERTVVVSVMLVNNETGIVQPLDDVAALVREKSPNAVLHTDAVQAPQ